MHRYTVVVDGKSFTLDVRELGAEEFRVVVDGKELNVKLADDQEVAEGAITPAIVLSAEAEALALASAAGSSPMQQPRAAGGMSRVRALTAPMPGVLVSIDVKEGAHVRRGDTLLTLEAMKMRNEIRAPRDAVIEEILVAEGQSVGFGDPLIRFEEQK